MSQAFIGTLTAFLLGSFGAVALGAPQMDGSIDIGGVPLELGMSQDRVLARVGNVYDVRHQDSVPGTWTVVRRGGPPYELLGAVAFRDGKLVFVTRSWESADNTTGNGLALAVHRAMKSLAVGQSRTCTVSTEATGMLVGTIVQCGRRRFSIHGSSDGSSSASVNETISVDP